MPHPLDEESLAYLHEDDGAEQPPPIAPLQDSLRFGDMDWREFERLCLRLVERTGEVEDAGLYGVPGERQEGIDLFARLGDGDYHVLQCRRWARMGPADIRKAVDDYFASKWFDRSSTFVLCTSADLGPVATAEEIQAQHARLRNAQKVFVTWGPDTLAERLRAEPALVRRFFGQAWVERFCDTDPQSDIPPLWAIRYSSPAFAHRDDELRQIDRAATATNSPRIAVHGLGGVGKTELAAAWAERNRERFRLGVWLPPGGTAARRAALADAARQLSGEHHGDEAAIDWLAQVLVSRSDWLLVLDDLEEPDDLRQVAPPGGGTILVTSRHHGGWRALGAAPVALDVFSEQDAVEYLCALSGDDDCDAARDVAEILGSFPLALAQAAAYCDRTATSLARYAELLDEHGLDLLAGDGPPAYDKTVRTTWTLALEIVDADPLATLILHGASFMTGAPIPRSVLTGIANAVDRTELDVDRALETLLGFSLVQPTDDGIARHDLLALVARERIAKRGDADKPLGLTIQVLREQLPQQYDDLAALELGRRLIDHARSLIEHGLERLGASDALLNLMHNSAAYLASAGDLSAALELYELELPLVVEAFGDHSRAHAGVLNDYAIALRQLDRLDDARTALGLALEIKEELGGPPALLLSSLESLAQVERARRELDSARALYSRATEVAVEAYGDDHPRFAMLLSNIGTLMLDDKQPGVALRTFERALAILAAAAGDQRLAELRIRANLGNALLDLGRADDAVVAHERTLADARELYPTGHPEIASTLSNLGNALVASDDARRAIEVYEEALEITAQSFGRSHPDYVRTLYNMAGGLREAGEPARAEATEAQARSIAAAIGFPLPSDD
ncbi:MAG TPA: tetratricopeptide repeat protein [Thermoleophilaceae bacterium]|nr:tetratricopeptide repeat protein [Thermoleophilaceae bacterium]